MALTLTAHVTLEQYDAVFINSDGEAALADADAAATMPCVTLCSAPDGILADAEGDFYQIGDVITAAGWSTQFYSDVDGESNPLPLAIGSFIYVSTTAGELTQTAPSGASDVVQIMGIAIGLNSIVLLPQLATVEIAAA